MFTADKFRNRNLRLKNLQNPNETHFQVNSTERVTTNADNTESTSFFFKKRAKISENHQGESIHNFFFACVVRNLKREYDQ